MGMVTVKSKKNLLKSTQLNAHYTFTPLNIVPEDTNVSIWSKVLSDWHSLTQLAQNFPQIAIRECDKKRKKIILSRFPKVMLEMTELGHSNLIDSSPAATLLIRAVEAQ